MTLLHAGYSFVAPPARGGIDKAFSVDAHHADVPACQYLLARRVAAGCRGRAVGAFATPGSRYDRRAVRQADSCHRRGRPPASPFAQITVDTSAPPTACWRAQRPADLFTDVTGPESPNQCPVTPACLMPYVQAQRGH